jgi:HPt (histidine-containing phosphotransfer) domain-containing protein
MNEPGGSGALILVHVDPDLWDLVRGFLANRSMDIPTIRAGLRQGDLTLIRRLGHNMKGEGSAYGLDGLSDLGAQIERSALQSDAPAIAHLTNALECYLGRVWIVKGNAGDDLPEQSVGEGRQK